MTAPRLLFLYLWIAPHALQAVLAAMMIRRKLVRRFPAFFTYTLYEVMQFLVLFTMDHMDSVSGEQYASVWLVGEAISIGLRFAVINEIFSNVFQSYPALQELGGVLFRWATVVLMLVAVTLVAYSSGSEVDRLTVSLAIVDRVVNIVQCGLLVLLILLARFLSFSWTNYTFGIALGLGFFASVELGISALRAQYGVLAAHNLFADLSMATYHCCVLFWIVTLLRPERGRTRVSSAPAHDLEHWNDALQRLLHQ
jgi:hypothetical protein